MALNNGSPAEGSVADMANSGLFQYLFKQDYDSDNLPAPLQGPSQATPNNKASSSSSTERTSEIFKEQTSIPTTIPLAYPTLLPSSSFSYRQISTDMPPPMPSQQSASTLPVDVEPTTLGVNSPTTTPPLSSVASDSMGVWIQRFQQLQQLQQLHHYQQHQLLSSTLLANSTHESTESTRTLSSSSSSPTHRDSSSERSVSPSAHSPTEEGDKTTTYPTPPMRDDICMDSDSEDHTAHGPDPLKPSASELKMMTSKERRQLRNKLSARNFRVRRKEYISTLEKQVKEARKEAADLQRRLIQSELNCQFLRQELETTRLSQSLFADGRMSKEHANLLASLLNPNSESFPTTRLTTASNIITDNSGSSSSSRNSSVFASGAQSLPQFQQSAAFLNAMALGNSSSSSLALDTNLLAAAPQTSTSSMLDVAQSTLQPFVPFDGDWGLLINRAEVPESAIDIKDEFSAQAIYQQLLTRYEAARQEIEVDEQLLAEPKVYTGKKLARTYMAAPKDESQAEISSNSSEDALLLQTMVYLMMIHVTQSLFQAATMSKSELVDMYQKMDEPLRTNMQRQGRHGFPNYSFSECREAWIKKCWPSFYNNRKRLAELFKNGPCSNCSNSTTQKGLDVIETVRKMEEGVANKTVAVPKVKYFVRHYIPTWLKRSDILERERLEDQAKAQHKANSGKAPVKVTAT
ncbi:hypothetical protein BC939DRAFT_169883 [Gamsiella multidivaricata]|uniref:uncharacterized protein n=1 Tax=Gamsiella multidivaricata TaxID=101098 RepID=UPI00221F5999|nr:uncharacterized protein BC939DRAFT_169883 [Gamsiella multidivaricata]KAG0364704.1 hypothetical protein BGZ54_007247 [Gamsiella multidivaricata]KAI7823007.1 hypothetical protein BC939DRAFT_169883 [Gamsiella multidivaricata]